MKPTLNEKLIAYLALLSGLSISAVAVYYSVAGLTAIFAGAVIPIIIMGTSLEISKLIATVWLKQNWTITPSLIKIYLLGAIAVLMLITSMGIFGFLSKAHLDQGIGSSDVAAKIAVYDEKIKTAKENIDANRKALKQMDEAVDQSMARSTTEAGAGKAVAIRKGQAKERIRLQEEITSEQKTISSLNEERAPIAAEVRKVEAEVGPIKYIAAFFYGATDQTVLEKAVTWVIIILIIVFDPLAVMLLLASQISFQNFRKREQEYPDSIIPTVNKTFTEDTLTPPITYNELSVEDISKLENNEPLFPVPKPAEQFYPYLYKIPVNRHPPGVDPVGPIVYNESIEETVVSTDEDLEKIIKLKSDIAQYGYSSDSNIVKVAGVDYTKEEFDRLVNSGYVQNEEQQESDRWTNATTVISQSEYMKTSQDKLNKE